MSPRLNCAAFVLATTLAAGPAAASLVTSVPVGIDAQVLTFSGYEGAANASFQDWVDGSSAPINVGAAEAGLGENVWLSYTQSTSYALGAVAQDFGSNGTWPGASGAYAGLNGLSGGMLFTFERDLDFVGGFMNLRVGDSSTTMLAFDADGNLIDFTALTIDFADPSGSGLGSFFGFQRDAGGAGIRSLLLQSNYVSIDNLSFGTVGSGGTGMPEPGSTGLVLASLGAMALTRRRGR